jgi:poly-gamma-glutamate synthesis protein (capsule biosynthesis protein)
MPAASEATPHEKPPGRVVLLAGGDVELGRAMGQRLLRDPTIDPLAPLAGWLAAADLRFVNLEGPISDQHGQTQSPQNSLIFTAPPAGADALARARIDLVSTANNHAWDYRHGGLLETLANLDRVGVSHVGTGADLAQAQAPLIIERGGLTLAFLAATDVWNQEGAVQSEARRYVAAAEASWLVPAVRGLKQRGVDAVIVSIHAGEEYQPVPLKRVRKLHRLLVEAGADLILGHHPHVLQGLGWQAGRPGFFSLGNLRMAMHSEHPETGLSLLARLTFVRGEPPRVEVCPLRQLGLEPRPLHREPDAAAQWSLFASRWRTLTASTGGGQLGPPGTDGCALVSPPRGPN